MSGVISVVDQLLRDMMAMYLFFAHREAWEIISDYFSWKLRFRGSADGVDSHDSSGKANWYTAITIPHFLYVSDWPLLHTVDIVGEIYSVLDKAPVTVIVEVCTSVCITGDPLGLFWTSSMLGTGTIAARGHHQIAYDVGNVIQRFKYDICSARSLVFVVQLTAACHVVSERLEVVMNNVKAVLDLEVSSALLISRGSILTHATPRRTA
jgi:hypothetical protein